MNHLPDIHVNLIRAKASLLPLAVRDEGRCIGVTCPSGLLNRERWRPRMCSITGAFTTATMTLNSPSQLNLALARGGCWQQAADAEPSQLIDSRGMYRRQPYANLYLPHTEES